MTKSHFVPSAAELFEPDFATAPRGFKGAWIPEQVYLDRRLSAIEKMIFIEIDSLDTGGGCFASNKYLAGFCQTSERTISRAVAHMIELGYVQVVSFDGRKRVLRSNLGCAAKQPRQIGEAEEPNWRASKNRLDTPSNEGVGKTAQPCQAAPPHTSDPAMEARKRGSAATPAKGKPTPKRPKAKPKREQLVELIEARFDDPQLRELLVQHLDILIEKRKTPTLIGFTAKLKKLEAVEDVAKQRWLVEYSVENGYQGLFFERLDKYPMGGAVSGSKAPSEAALRVYGYYKPEPKVEKRETDPDMPAIALEHGCQWWTHFHLAKFLKKTAWTEGIECRCENCRR